MRTQDRARCVLRSLVCWPVREQGCDVWDWVLPVLLGALLLPLWVCTVQLLLAQLASSLISAHT